MNSFIKSLLTCALLCCCSCFINIAKAQQDHFIYIQSDDKLPFNVSVNGKIYSSSDPGYVIIPKLADGNYTLAISFADNKYPDQKFYCSISKNDAGYALKNYPDKGWGLFNLQTFDITMAGDTAVTAVTKQNTNTGTDDNAFGNMLSQVVNDSTLSKPTEIVNKPKPVEEKQETINDTLLAQLQQNPLTQDTSAAMKTDSNATAQIQTPVDSSNAAVVVQDQNIVPKKADVEKIGEQTTDAGLEQIFIDRSSGDTIRITMSLAPVEDSTAVVSADTTQKVPEKIDTVTATVKEETNPPADTMAVKPVVENTAGNTSDIKNPFYKKEQTQDTATAAITSDVKNETADSNTQNPVTNTAQGYAYKADCKYVLTDGDMDKIRKKMVSASNDQKMIQVVEKYTQTNCITTAQAKSLSALFFTDEGRYNFFDAIYKAVYDQTQFATLESQLIDPYYKKRFRAMLK